MTTTNKSKSADNGKTDTTSEAQGRFTVAIPAALRPELDALQKQMGTVTVNGVSLEVQLTYAQVIATLIKSAMQGEPQTAGDTDAS